MKELSAILKEKYGNSTTAKRAQLRNEIVVRGDEILAELAKGWSLRAIWTALSERKELTCGYKTFIAHVRRLQHQAATTKPRRSRQKNEKDSPGIQHQTAKN